MRKVVLTLLFTIASLVYSFAAVQNPAPLGLELEKATIEDAKKKYSLKFIGINKFSLGKMFEVPADQIGIDGLKKAELIFDKKGVLQVVILTFPKDFGDTNWKKLYNHLRNKYRLIKSRVPFVGDKYAEFEAGNTVIMLDSKHLSFNIDLIYATKWFLDVYSKVKKEEQRAKQRNLENNL